MVSNYWSRPSTQVVYKPPVNPVAATNAVSRCKVETWRANLRRHAYEPAKRSYRLKGRLNPPTDVSKGCWGVSHGDLRVNKDYRAVVCASMSSDLAAGYETAGPSGSSDLDTIIGIATPVVPQTGGVAIVRLSGDTAVEVVRQMFVPRGSASSANKAESVWIPESHRVVYGNAVGADGKCLDEVLVLPMLAPRSYTKEDVVEIHCHGGSVCTRRVVERAVQCGARHANPGEFTLRAFLNGRIDLAQAEAVQQLIAAQTSAAADGALASMRGGDGPAEAARAARAQCISLLAEVEARLDFEDDLPPLDQTQVTAGIRELVADVEQALDTARKALVAHTGLQVALVGRPNVGKSSLLNAWTRSERAIVTDQAGTTRDVLEARVEVAGVPVTLLDTAGIRASSDVIEQIGVQRSEAAATSADIVLMVADAERGWGPEDEAVYEGLRAAAAAAAAAQGTPPTLLVWNKVDLLEQGGPARSSPHGRESEPPSAANAGGDAEPPAELQARFEGWAGTSGRTGAGLDALERHVARIVGSGGALSEGRHWAASERQVAALQEAAAALRRLEETVQREDIPVDMWSVDLRDATHALGSVTGEEVTEDVLDAIFSRFCIGK